MNIYNYWGKSRRGTLHGGDDYHLLCWHSLDVAAVGYRMVENNIHGIADYFKKIKINDVEQAAQFFAWLLCWHDIGKFAHSFQQLYRHEGLNNHNEAHKNYELFPHATLGYWLWNSHLSEYPELLPVSDLSFRRLKRVIARWMPLTTGHHGRPPSVITEINNFRDRDKEAAREFLSCIKPLFSKIVIPECWDDDEDIIQLNAFSWFISAAIVLADWVGSSTHYFPRVAQKVSIPDYWQQALHKAQQAVNVFPPAAAVSPFIGIETLFPFIECPTPLQRTALELDIDKNGAQLFILEDVTGAGKTEAALTLTHRLMAAGKAQGLFFGLPTMATANAMYDRMAKTWLSLYQPGSRPSLVLAHSARRLMDRFNHSLWTGDMSGSEEWDEMQPFSQGCAAWFADSNKKSLLADVGVNAGSGHDGRHAF